jgi:DNA repair exonuclease SbcCD ATPase subunit
MRINKVKYQNFYSARNITVDFSQYNGLTIIDGKNGAGKSVLFEAVVWGITGRTIRKSTEEAMVNFAAKRECKVEVWIGDDVYIKRSRKPSSLMFKVGDEWLTKEDARATQKAIDTHLNTNYKVLMASMVFGQHSEIDFLGATTDDKRIIIRNFLNLEDIFVIRDRIKAFKSDYSTEKKSIDSVLSEIEGQSKDLGAKIEALGDIPEIPDISLEEILAREKEKEECEKNIKAPFNRVSYINSMITSKEKDLKDLLENKACKSCGQSIQDSILEDHKMELENSLSGFRIGLKIQEDLQKKNEEALEKINIPISSKEYAALTDKIRDAESLSIYKHQLQELDIRKEELGVKKLSAIENYEVMRFWEKAFSELGLIRYVIKNVLSFFNDKCNTYLYHLGAGKYFIKFDDQLKEEIWTNKNKISYISLSGGEKRKLNLAVMLGLQDLLQLTSKGRSNLLFFDEIGENLDAEGLYGLYILLQQIKKEGKTIFLITHNDHFKSLLHCDHKMSVKNINGITKIT